MAAGLGSTAKVAFEDSGMVLSLLLPSLWNLVKMESPRREHLPGGA